MLALALLPVVAAAGRRKVEEPVVVVVEPEPVVQVPWLGAPLFPPALPIEAGGVPDGLANQSAQGCAACHPASHRGWLGGAHAGAPSPELRAAAAEAGSPVCLSCHLPLVAQHEDRWTFDAGRLDRPVLTDNPAFDPTLAFEGVTCAACHVRDGAVVVSTADAAARPSPHRMVVAPELSSVEGCAACHQLTWPGAAEPLYDTVGEWQRSMWAAAGVGCLDCHGGAGADPRLGVDHGPATDPARAVSVLLRAPTLRVARGEPPVAATLVLQNTGSGHAFPTGSPYVGVRVRAEIVGPPDKKGAPTFAAPPVVFDLVRAPATDTTPGRDDRLAAGATRELAVPISVPADAPSEGWTLSVTLVRTVRGVERPGALLRRDWPLEVR